MPSEFDIGSPMGSPIAESTPSPKSPTNDEVDWRDVVEDAIPDLEASEPGQISLIEVNTTLAQHVLGTPLPTLEDSQVCTNNNRPSTPSTSGSKDSDDDYEFYVLSEAFKRTKLSDSPVRAAVPNTAEPRTLPDQIITEAPEKASSDETPPESPPGTFELIEKEMDELIERARNLPRPAVRPPTPRQQVRDKQCRADATDILNMLEKDTVQREEYNVYTQLKVETCRIMDLFEGRLRIVPGDVPVFTTDAVVKLFDEIRATLEYTIMMGNHHDAAKRSGNPDLGPDDADLLQIQVEAAQRLDRTTKSLNEFLKGFMKRLPKPLDLHQVRVKLQPSTRVNLNLAENMALNPYYIHQATNTMQLITAPAESPSLYVEEVTYDDTSISFTSRFRADRCRGFHIVLSPFSTPFHPITRRPYTRPVVYSVHLTYPGKCTKSEISFEETNCPQEIPQGLIGARVINMETIRAPHDARHRFKDSHGCVSYYVGLKTDRGDFYIRSVHTHADNEVCTHEILVNKGQPTPTTVKFYV